MCAPEKETVRLVRQKAMKLLEYSDKTEQQLRERLEEGEFPPSAIDETIEYLKSLNYLNDQRFAESFIRSRAGQKSASEIRMQLLQKGVSKETADAALTDAELDEEAVVKRLFQKKYARLDLTDPDVYRKAFQYFSRKGFRYETIKNALTEITENS